MLTNDNTTHLAKSNTLSNLQKKQIKKEQLIFSTGSLTAKIGVKRPLSVADIEGIKVTIG